MELECQKGNSGLAIFGRVTMDRLRDFNQQPDSPALTLRSRAVRSTTAEKFSTSRLVAFAVVLLAGMALLTAVRSAVAQDVPDATIEFSGGSVAAGIGFTWGRGELTFQGKKYPLRVSGLSIVHVGISSYTASGAVYHLTKASDINGIYTAVSAGVAVAGGASATAMRNASGVVIQMVSTHAGLNFSLGTKGVSIALR
jgi:hypothetical protein